MNVKSLKLLLAAFLLCVLNIGSAQQTNSPNDNPSLVKVKNRLVQLNNELKDIDQQIAHVSSDPKLYEQSVKDGSWNKYQEVKTAKKAEILEWENIRTSLEQTNTVPAQKVKITREEYNALPAVKQQAILNSGNYEIVD